MYVVPLLSEENSALFPPPLSACSCNLSASSPIKNSLFCVNTIDSLFVYFVRAPDMRMVRPSPSALAIRCVGKLRGLPLCLPFAMPIFRSHRTGTLGQGYAHIPPC